MQAGCHISISGGIHLAFERALEVGCEALQIFTQNQRQWKSVTYSQEQISRFKAARADMNFGPVPLTAHASYLINMCAADDDKLRKSRTALLDELKRCDSLGLEYLVIHPGSHGGRGEQWGLDKIAETLDEVLSLYSAEAKILLETTAGQGHNLGYCFEHLAQIIDRAQHNEALGVCIDTCHIFAAGYDIEDEQGWRETFARIEQSIGLQRVHVLHLNDSQKEKGSRRDRHAPLGEGFIGLKSFEILMNTEAFAEAPAILEIPGGMDKFAENIKLLKAMRRPAKKEANR